MSRLFLAGYGKVTKAAYSDRPRSVAAGCAPLVPPRRGGTSLGSSPRFPARAGKQKEKAVPAGTMQARLRTYPDRPPPRGVKARTPTLKLKWSGRAESNRREEFGKLPFYH